MKDLKKLTDSDLENLREEIEIELCERKNFNFMKYKVGEVYIKKYDYDKIFLIVSNLTPTHVVDKFETLLEIIRLK